MPLNLQAAGPPEVSKSRPPVAHHAPALEAAKVGRVVRRVLGLDLGQLKGIEAVPSRARPAFHKCVSRVVYRRR